MRIKTLIEHKNQLQIADVELALLPGIPNIHFLGLPDQSIKESFFRIKSALKACGFKFPGNQQVIVNIHPSQLRKSSQGLELAVAMGILALTGQKNILQKLNQPIVYGEIGLNGEVFCPQNLSQFLETALPASLVILTGQNHKVSHQTLWTMETLKAELIRHDPQIHTISEEEQLSEDENIRKIFLSEGEAEVVELACLTGMNLLLCGAPGSGKTTLAKNFAHFAKYGVKAKANIPVLMPHHSVTPGGFIGGGTQLSIGEIERVRGGILIMDEFLEFQSAILESLRGPMLGEPLRLVRGASARMIAADFQVIATTNLCPCGKWTPLSGDISCRFTRIKCTRYLDRLTGPMLDRFGLFFTYPQTAQPRKISAFQVMQKVLKRKLQMKSLETKSQNGKIGSLVENLYGDLSARRLDSMHRAIQAADLDQKNPIPTNEIIKKAARFTIESFVGLEKGH